MEARRDNYAIQAAQAKKLFLTYDQQELIDRCGLQFDDEYFYIRFLSYDYRIRRSTGDMERFARRQWVDGNSFEEVMTILDWLCDSRRDRCISGRWVSVLSLGHHFHRNLQESPRDARAEVFDKNREAFADACRALQGVQVPGADMAFAIELLDGLNIVVQLWFGDEEFPPRLRLLWDENTLRYIRYETTWYAAGLLYHRIWENMQR